MIVLKGERVVMVFKPHVIGAVEKPIVDNEHVSVIAPGNKADRRPTKVSDSRQ